MTINDAIKAMVGIGQPRLIAAVDTFLKRSASQAFKLTDADKLAVPKGFEIAVTKIEINGDSHYVFESEDPRFFGKGFAFVAHFTYTGEVSKPVELVSREQADYIFERTVDDAIFIDLNNCLTKFDITDKEDIRQFLAQCAHESGGLRWLKELASGDDYEWREDLGNNQSGDGRRYKGGGVIQLTGRENYTKFSEFMGDPEIVNQGVDYVASKFPVSSAAYWWKMNNISEYIADGATIEQVSSRVNGTHPANGLEDRIYYYERAKQVI